MVKKIKPFEEVLNEIGVVDKYVTQYRLLKSVHV